MNSTHEHQAFPLESLEKLAPFPLLALRLLELSQDETADWDDFAGLIAADAALTARTLRTANSALHGASGEIGSLSEAVARFGTNGVAKLVMESCLRECFSPSARGLRETLAFLWRWSLATAQAAEIEAGASGVDPHRAYTAGLLLKLPYVALAQHDPEELIALQESVESGSALQAAERERLGDDHAGLCGTALQHWSFPHELVASVRHHHSPDAAGEFEGLAETLRSAECLGSLVMASHPRHAAGDWLLEGARTPGEEDPRYETLRRIVARMREAAEELEH